MLAPKRTMAQRQAGARSAQAIVDSRIPRTTTIMRLNGTEAYALRRSI